MSQKNRNKEIRAYSAACVEVRARKEGEESRIIAGYAVKWGMRSSFMGFYEVFQRGAFAEYLSDAAREVLLLNQHDWKQPLARRTNGTLKVEEDDIGLKFEAELNDSTRAADVIKDIESGNVGGTSFCFRSRKETYTDGEWDNEKNPVVREILKADLYEISPVTVPAYPDSEVGTRDIESAVKEAYADFKRSKSPQKRFSIPTARARVRMLELKFINKGKDNG